MIFYYQTVISGGISKIRSKTSIPTSTTLCKPASVPQAQPPPQPISGHNDPANAEISTQNHDTSICSTVEGGIAERLVMYSQKPYGYVQFTSSRHNGPLCHLIPFPGHIYPPNLRLKSGVTLIQHLHSHRDHRLSKTTLHLPATKIEYRATSLISSISP